MGKTITISDEAYKRLKSHKREGESFSKVIEELVPFPVRNGRELVERMTEIVGKSRRGNARKAS